MAAKKISRKQCYIVAVSVCVMIKIFYFVNNLSKVSEIVMLRSYEKDFQYPLDMNLAPLVDDILAERIPSVEPINYYSYPYLFNSNLCTVLPQIDLIIAVKSAIDHFDRRKAIRKTYGKADNVKGKVVRTLFFVGVHTTENIQAQRLQNLLEREIKVYKDIVQASFVDDYYLNTIKTMMIFKWFFEFCPNSKYSLFADDDMFVSPANLLRYLDYWEAEVNNTDQDQRLVAGYVYHKFEPRRTPNTKWFVSLMEYPWDAGPPFPSGGAIIMNSAAVESIYAASLFVAHMVYDDVYIGIVAHKLGLELTHSHRVKMFANQCMGPDVKELIACHGYENPKKLVEVWNVVSGTKNLTDTHVKK